MSADVTWANMAAGRERPNGPSGDQEVWCKRCGARCFEVKCTGLILAYGSLIPLYACNLHLVLTKQMRSSSSIIARIVRTLTYMTTPVRSFRGENIDG